MADSARMTLGRAFSLENIFLVVSLAAGVLFAVLVPPNQVPDEELHVARVFGILRGDFTSGSVYLPARLNSLLERYFYADVEGATVDRPQYIGPSVLKSDTVASEPRRALQYGPVPYSPHVIGMGLGFGLGLADATAFLMGRLTSVLVYAAIGYALLRRAPAARTSLFVILTMPMCLYLAASYSADPLNNLLCLAFAIMIARGLNSPGKLTAKESGVLLIGSLLLGLSKPLSGIFAVLVLALPERRFAGRPQKLKFTLMALGLGLLPALYWLRIAARDPMQPSYDYIEPANQLMFILTNPLAYARVILTTVGTYGDTWLRGIVGMFGWLRSPVPDFQLPDFAYALFIVSLACAIWADQARPLTLTRGQRNVFWGTLLAFVIATITAVYMNWSPVGAPLTTGIQGRHLIPIIPLLLFLAASYVREGALSVPRSAQVVAVALVPLTLFFGLQSVFLKYYVPCGDYFYDAHGTCALPGGLVPEAPTGEILHPIQQTFTPDCSGIAGVDLYLSTYMRQNTGELAVTLRDQSNRTSLFGQVISVENVRDNAWLSLLFPAVRVVEDHALTLTLTPIGGAPGNAVTAWTTDSDVFPGGELVGAQAEGDLVFRYRCPYGLVHAIQEWMP